MWKDFRAFLMRGNVLELAVAFIIGAAFSSIVKSLVDDVIMPPIGLALGNVDFSNLFAILKSGPNSPPPYASLAEAKAAGAVTLNYGVFINQVITFFIVALAVFLIIRAVNRLQGPAPATAPTTKPCDFCKLEIPLNASRCPHCTSQFTPTRTGA